MYDYISGRLISKSPTEVTIEAGGVGVGDKVRIMLDSAAVRED